MLQRYLWSQKERHCWTHLCFSQLRHSNTALKRRVCNWSSGLNAWHCSIVAQFESCASVSQVIWPESFEVPRLVAFECPTLFTPSKSFTRTDLRSSQAKRPKAWRELMLQLLRHWNHWCGTKSHLSNIPTNHAKAATCLLNCKDMQRHSLPVFIWLKRQLGTSSLWKSISLKLAFNLIKYNNPLHGIAASSLHKPKPVSRQKTGPALWPVKIFWGFDLWTHTFAWIRNCKGKEKGKLRSKRMRAAAADGASVIVCVLASA